jgi:hypothetical protein
MLVGCGWKPGHVCTFFNAFETKIVSARLFEINQFFLKLINLIFNDLKAIILNKICIREENVFIKYRNIS